MKIYRLSIVSPFCNSNNVSKRFKSRNEAINYAFKKLPLGTTVEEEIVRDENSSIEYVCSNRNRFTIFKQCV